MNQPRNMISKFVGDYSVKILSKVQAYHQGHEAKREASARKTGLKIMCWMALNKINNKIIL